MPQTPRITYEAIHEIEGGCIFEFDLLESAKHLFPRCETNGDIATKFLASSFGSPAWRNCSTPDLLRFAFNSRPQGIGLVDMLNNYLVEKARLFDQAAEF